MASRRGLLLGGAAILSTYLGLRHGLPVVISAFAPDFQFRPLANVPGFRRIAGGTVSGGPDGFIGLDAPAPELGPRVSELRAEPCTALFDKISASDVVPIASFSDYNCPYCRILSPMLERLQVDPSVGTQVTWHELPLLGASSVYGARAALAARRQGAYDVVHQRLMAARFQPTEGYIAEMAANLDLDSQQLFSDMRSDAVSDDVLTGLALGRIFGLIGTPALIVGRTVVLGAIDERRLRRLIAREREDGAGPCSA